MQRTDLDTLYERSEWLENFLEHSDPCAVTGIEDYNSAVVEIVENVEYYYNKEAVKK